MNNTLRISFSLKITYKVNTILYSLKQIPLIRKLLPNSLYNSRGLKTFAKVIAIIWEILSIFIGKLLYVSLMIFMLTMLYEKEDSASLFLHILFFLSLIGAFMNTYMFNPTKDKYYALIIMRMNAKEFTLVDYFYSMLKLLVGFIISALIFGLNSGLTVWQCLLIPVFVAGLKLSYAAYCIVSYEKTKDATNENNTGKLRWILIFVFLLAAYVPPIFDIMLPQMITCALMRLPIVIGIFSIIKIVKFNEYYDVYRQLLTETVGLPMDTSAVKAINEQTLNMISTDTDISSNKKGYEYLNELFIKRHRKLLWKPAKTVSLVSLALVAAATLALLIFPEAHAEINEVLLTFLPYFVFIMYAINRGTGFTRALFINCDHCLLTYSFYKQPKHILKLFQIRLREIIKVNLIPALVIGPGLALLLFVTGGTDNPLNYLVLIVSIVCMSIFFSVHYLTLYYLLQPYNSATEIKSGTYQLITSLTYFVSYMMMQFQLPTIAFGLATIAFCIVYWIIACALIYKLAPKTFRIRN